MSEQKIRVVVAGACGRMGKETCKAVSGAPDLDLAGACDPLAAGKTISQVVEGVSENGPIYEAVDSALAELKPDVLVDFTTPSVVMDNIRTAVRHGVSIVVGTTGVTPDKLKDEAEAAKKAGIGILIAPNFAIGAVLMMKFASEAAKYMPSLEIIELHHDKKLDAPSGTAIITAGMISAAGGSSVVVGEDSPARGDDNKGVRIHSVRLPGLVAHQEVIFGGLGQTLTIRHDSLDRTSFMPGVLLAVRKVRDIDGLVYGLDKIL